MPDRPGALRERYVRKEVDLSTLGYGSFRCESCQREWVEELPPLRFGLAFWPTCCEERAHFGSEAEPPVLELRVAATLADAFETDLLTELEREEFTAAGLCLDDDLRGLLKRRAYEIAVELVERIE